MLVAIAVFCIAAGGFIFFGFARAAVHAHVWCTVCLCHIHVIAYMYIHVYTESCNKDLPLYRCLCTGTLSEGARQKYSDQFRDVRDSLQAVGFSKDVSFKQSLNLITDNHTCLLYRRKITC